MPQGSLLAPILFSLFLNDIFLISFQNHLLAFADDMKLFGEVNSKSSLQRDADLLHKWLLENDLKLNCQKCKVLHFGIKNPDFCYEINEEILSSNNSEKDLGVLIDINFSFSEHIALVVKKLLL